MKLSSHLLIVIFLLVSCYSLQTVDLSDIQNQVKLQWSFISQIQHTWFQNIVNKYFISCIQHQQLKALYNCNTTIQSYKNFWQQFIQGIQQIKFKKNKNKDQQQQQQNHQQQQDEEIQQSWSMLMIDAAQQWITVNKTSSFIQIQQAYQDISNFPNNLMQFAQFDILREQVFEDFQKLIKWQRQSKKYLTKKDKTDQQMKNDQTIMFKKYFDSQCFQSQKFMEQCKMPLKRYSYYLRDLFFYYFQQPQKYSKYNQKTKLNTIDPVLDYKITKLWRDMRLVMVEHLGLGEEVSLEQIQKISPDILQSVMESLVKRKANKVKQENAKQEKQNSEL